jgi:hypothetical protein
MVNPPVIAGRWWFASAPLRGRVFDRKVILEG